MTARPPGRNNSYYAGERPDLIALIPYDAKRILDVGCGCGNMCRRIKSERDAEVAGIEKDEEAAAIARRSVDKFVMGDVEEARLDFEKGYFDCIVYGSILEHLKDPWKVLKEHTYYLKKGGCCVACLPNISHYSVIKDLFKDRWEYKPEGLLDVTHLRFFTLSGIIGMFRTAGYRIDKVNRFIRGSKSKKFINKVLRGKIDYLLTEEYIIRARLD